MQVSGDVVSALSAALPDRAESGVAVPTSAAVTPQAFLNDAVAHLASLLNIAACMVLLSDDGELHPVAAIGLPEGHGATPDTPQLPPGFGSRWSIPLALPGGAVLGELVAYSRESQGLDDDALELVRAFGSVIALALDRLNRQWGLAARYQGVVIALTSALDTRDEYSGDRLTAESSLAVQVGRRLGIDADQLELISQVAVLHDIGKLGVPSAVLRKPGPLDTDEQALIREHPAIGERILGAIPGLDEVAGAIRHEHERWDGGGYPDGLAGEQIPLASRIVFACDTWQAMTSDRPYRDGLPPEHALRELREGAGTQFDPRVAQALLEVLGEQSPLPPSSPLESRDRAVSSQLEELAAELGAEDLFVFRRVAGRLYSHLDGAGRGAGWAGNVELDSAVEEPFLEAVSSGRPKALALERTGRIVGPYYARSAVIVPCSEDAVVVFGSSTDALHGLPAASAIRAAERAHEIVVEVSPAKRLADELEILHAVREVMAVSDESIVEALSAIAERARIALNAEFAAVATIPVADAAMEVGFSAGAWEPREEQQTQAAMARFTVNASELPILHQDIGEMPDAPEGFRLEDGVSSIHVLPIGAGPEAVMLAVHAEPGLRGFTELCQRVAGGLSDAADLVIRRALAQERLRGENARLSQVVRTDALTGVASRAAWETALEAEERHRGRSGAPVSVVIVDVDELKSINDKAGHAAGDELLRKCAAVLAGSVRATDLVARIGGDEFGVLLRYTNADQAQVWCDRLEERLREVEERSPRWSVGFASVPPHETLDEALHEADRWMYRRKRRHHRSGRR